MVVCLSISLYTQSSIPQDHPSVVRVWQQPLRSISFCSMAAAATATVFFLNPVWCWENIYCSWLRFSVAHAKTWQKFLCAAVLACPSFSTDRWKYEKCVTRDVVYSARKSSSCADTRHTNWGILVFSRLSVWFTECDRNVCGTTNEEEHECDSTFHHLV